MSVADSQIDGILGNSTGGVLGRLPGKVSAIDAFGYLDGRGGAGVAGEASLKRRHFRPRTATAGVYAGHAKLVRGARFQFRLAQEAHLAGVKSDVEVALNLSNFMEMQYC